MKVFISYLVFLGVLLLSISAAACDCFKPDAKEGLKYADIAFRGELIQHSGSYDIFSVEECWKGDMGRTVKFVWRDG